MVLGAVCQEQGQRPVCTLSMISQWSISQSQCELHSAYIHQNSWNCKIKIYAFHCAVNYAEIKEKEKIPLDHIVGQKSTLISIILSYTQLNQPTKSRWS